MKIYDEFLSQRRKRKFRNNLLFEEEKKTMRSTRMRLFRPKWDDKQILSNPNKERQI